MNRGKGGNRYFVLAFTGPECSGKTTLSRWASKVWDGIWIEEYARAYLSWHGPRYRLEDIVQIARHMHQLWDKKIGLRDGHYFLDTDALNLIIWAKVRFGEVPDELVSLWNKQKVDLYFLCDPDIPWEYDPLRENPYDRPELFELYKRFLDDCRAPYCVVGGHWDLRVARVQREMQILISQ